MSEIKSEKAKQYINYHCIDIDTIYPLTNDQVEEVIVIAETEAEERHTKALQELKDRAVEAYKANCRIYTPCCLDKQPCTADCEYLAEFTQKINKK